MGLGSQLTGGVGPSADVWGAWSSGRWPAPQVRRRAGGAPLKAPRSPPARGWAPLAWGTGEPAELRGLLPPRCWGTPGPHQVPGVVQDVPGGTGAGVLVAAACREPHRSWSRPPGAPVAPWRSAQPRPGSPAASRALPQARPSCLRVARGQGAEGHSLSSGGGQPCPCPCPSPAPHLPLPVPDLLEVLSDVDEMSRRRPEVLGFFSVSGLGVWGAHTPTPAVSFEAGMEKPRGPGPSLRRRGQHVCEPSLLGAPSRRSRDRVTSLLWSLLVLGTSRPQGRGSPGRPATGQRPGGWGPAGPLCSRPRA